MPDSRDDTTGSGQSGASPPGGGTPGDQVRPEEAVRSAEQEARRLRTEEQPLGRPGRPMDHRSPFFVGMAGAAGVAITYLVVQLIVSVRGVLVLIGLAWFLAVGLDPPVAWLRRRGVPRWAGVTAVSLSVLGVTGGFVAAAVPPLIEQSSQLVHSLPSLLRRLGDRSSWIGRINDELHLQQRLEAALSGQTQTLVAGLLGAGKLVFGTVASTVTVAVLGIYFLADLPRIRRTIYRLVPRSRRPRVILIGDQTFAGVGGFVLGNLITSLIAAVATFVWCVAVGIPYAVLLSLFVALMDLIPIVGSTLAGAVVSLTALVVSVPIAIATVGYIVVYRLAEDYLLVPKIIGRAVHVPAVVTVVAVLIGGGLLGIIGALVAIPIAAAIRLVLDEVLFPSLDEA